MHQAQGVGQRAFALAVDHQRGVVAQVVDAAFDVVDLEAAAAHRAEPGAGAVDQHGVAVEHQLAVELREGRPAGGGATRLGMQQAGRHVVELGVAHIAADHEFAGHALAEGNLPQVAVDLEAHVAQLAALDGVLQVGAGFVRDGGRQVARHAGRPALGDGGVELQRAGQPGAGGQAVVAGRIAGGPGGFERALHVVVDYAGAVGAHFDAGRQAGLLGGGDCPVEARIEFAQREHGLVEHAGQRQRAVAHAHVGLAAALAGVEAGIEVLDAGPAGGGGGVGHRAGRQGQAAHPAPGGVAARAAGGVVPLPAQGFDLAARVEFVQLLAQRLADRDAVGQPVERGEVELAHL